MSSENHPNNIEEERRKLGELNRRLLVLMGNIEDVEKCIAVIRKEATETYLEIDKKLNEKGAKNEEQNCATGRGAAGAAGAGGGLR